MKNRSSITIIFLVIMTFGMSVAFLASDFNQFMNKPHITIEGNQFTPDFSAYNFKTAGLQKNTYRVTIKASEFSTMSGDYRIIVYRLADNGYKVYFNNQLIGSIGDIVDGNSNSWNKLTSFVISQNLLRPENELRFETTSIYRSGLSSRPIFIIEDQESMKFLTQHVFFGEQMNLLSIGFIMFSSAFSVILYLLTKSGNKVYLYTGIATFLTGLYFIDYISFGTTLVSYLLYKKITIGSLFLGGGFYGHVIGGYFENKISHRLANITIFGTLFLLIFSDNMIIFKTMYTYWYLMLLINMLFWIVLSIKKARNSMTAYIFFVGFSILGIYAACAVFMDIFGGYFSLNSPIIYITTFASVPLLLSYEGINEKEHMISKERSLREKEFLNSVTDELTGLWNQRYLATLMKEHINEFTLAIIDIDDFKGINDTYGHLAGDFVLKSLAQQIQHIVGDENVLCRYGGDEFVALFQHNSMSDVYDILEQIRDKVEKHKMEYKGNHIHVTLSMGMSQDAASSNIEDVFRQADEQLYIAKDNGKNRIAFESSKLENL